MVPDQVILLLVQDNIDTACQAIEKAAMDRAIVDVDESFAPAYEARRRHRQVCSRIMYWSVQYTYAFQLQTSRGQVFWDATALHTNYSASLPDPLRIKPSGVQANQIGVYEDFGMSGLWNLLSCTHHRQVLTPNDVGPVVLPQLCLLLVTTLSLRYFIRLRPV